MIKEFEYEVRPVVGYNGKYSVSNTGQVFSHDYRHTGQTREMKPGKNTHGYLFVNLYQDGKTKQHSVHRLVLNAFVPNPDNKSCCDHIDTNRVNNHVNNLRWVTRKENNNNPLSKAKMSNAQKGEKSHRYDTTIYKFRNKNTNEEFVGTRCEFYTKYDLNQSAVSWLVNGKFNHFKGWVLV